MGRFLSAIKCPDPADTFMTGLRKRPCQSNPHIPPPFCAISKKETGMRVPRTDPPKSQRSAERISASLDNSAEPGYKPGYVRHNFCAWVIIYLGLTLPPGSSNLPEGRRAALCLLLGLASDGVCRDPACYQTGGSLLHCLSTLTGILRQISGGIFLLHFPRSHLHRTLSGVLPCEARTFLTCACTAATTRPAQRNQISILT